MGVELTDFPDFIAYNMGDIDLPQLLQSISLNISKNGFNSSTIPTFLRTFCAGELISALPPNLVMSLFKCFAEDRCKYLDAKFVDKSDKQIIITFSKENTRNGNVVINSPIVLRDDPVIHIKQRKPLELTTSSPSLTENPSKNVRIERSQSLSEGFVATQECKQSYIETASRT